ncbi:hypothetical protein B0H19DRAFT_1266630 [Mycena capillaripes]|nr:hypothetical protein B0H19DRAFT_1266630 [Mycena capillaripes]
MVSCFDFFSLYLERGDYPALVHAVKVGFIAAFLDCSPTFRLVPTESAEIALNIVRQSSHRILFIVLLAQPVVAGILRLFIALLTKRGPPLEQMYSRKGEEKAVQCHCINCRLVDVKSNFKRYAACELVHYCFPRCQMLAWKSAHKHLQAAQSGIHRRVPLCLAVLSEQSYYKGRPETDRTLLQFLSHWETNIMAKRKFPDVPHADLMPCIDFRKVPKEYSVRVIEPGAMAHRDVVHSPEDAATGEARFQALVTKVRGSGTPTMQSVIPSGAAIEILYTEMQ